MAKEQKGNCRSLRGIAFHFKDLAFDANVPLMEGSEKLSIIIQAKTEYLNMHCHLL
jgi:hypothetical protein